ncbi:hypothetical protein FN846DRAFT_625604 [Sphaerosporella brunnea]|uniref:Uncharacterized protein n=1 Tax=Sphaerosporella brunnea TaxID=1250544 RepID=A0A5J5F176_9PEZI|nr:hypothetical protein FN846DRAFT_625604 [Sphaerosporella brunnea]
MKERHVGIQFDASEFHFGTSKATALVLYPPSDDGIAADISQPEINTGYLGSDNCGQKLKRRQRMSKNTHPRPSEPHPPRCEPRSEMRDFDWLIAAGLAVWIFSPESVATGGGACPGSSKLRRRHAQRNLNTCCCFFVCSFPSSKQKTLGALREGSWTFFFCFFLFFFLFFLVFFCFFLFCFFSAAGYSLRWGKIK